MQSTYVGKQKFNKRNASVVEQSTSETPVRHVELWCEAYSENSSLVQRVHLAVTERARYKTLVGLENSSRRLYN